MVLVQCEEYCHRYQHDQGSNLCGQFGVREDCCKGKGKVGDGHSKEEHSKEEGHDITIWDHGFNREGYGDHYCSDYGEKRLRNEETQTVGEGPQTHDLHGLFYLHFFLEYHLREDVSTGHGKTYGDSEYNSNEGVSCICFIGTVHKEEHYDEGVDQLDEGEDQTPSLKNHVLLN